MNTLLHQVEMLNRFTSEEGEGKDYDRAVTYCTNILTNCPASVHHSVLKCEYLLRANKLKEACTFSNELMLNQDMKNVPLVKCWRGRGWAQSCCRWRVRPKPSWRCATRAMLRRAGVFMAHRVLWWERSCSGAMIGWSRRWIGREPDSRKFF